MQIGNYKGFSMRTKIFIGFMIVCTLSILISTTMSYVILRNTAISQSKTDMQGKAGALLSALDYALSETTVTPQQVEKVLNEEIYQIADINKQDIVLYDLNGRFLHSNREKNLIDQQTVPKEILKKLSNENIRVDVASYDSEIDANVTSSYMMLRNNMLEPVGIVYFPFYHSDHVYKDIFSNYIQYMVVINLLLILLSIWISWLISKNLTGTISALAKYINDTNLLGKELKPIKYYRDDEINSLVKAYNQMILQIEEQKNLLAYKEKEDAWKEMAKQVAHEVKNPLTPMKLQIQNFERKFDVSDPDIQTKVHNLSRAMTEQIDTIATVASAFSEFAKLPEKKDQVINLNREIKNLSQVLNEDNIFIHSNREEILMKMDKVYLSRIITNLLTNAKQAESDLRKSIINIDLELINKKVLIKIQDNGTGIEKEQLSRIFEPTFTTKNGGTGLGLTMVKKLISEYKGEIFVKSEWGKGTIFTIVLPTNM